MGTHPIFESDFDCLTEHVMEHDGHEGHGDHDMGGHEMHMNMYFTEDLGFYVLFQGWMVMDSEQLAGSCIGMLIFAILLEGIKSIRMTIEQNVAKVDPENGSSGPTIKTLFNCSYLLSSFLYIFQVTLSYSIMLAAMSFSTYIFISIIAGFTIGNYLFAWRHIGQKKQEDCCP